MKILTLVQTEFRRLTATGLARLALVALMLVPVIYAGLYLWANSDPYAQLKNIPVALVVEDTGATLDGTAVDYGTQVHDQLMKDNSVKWIDATADEAASGVKNGEYDFVLTLGPDFSTLLTSAGTATPEQAVVQLTTNDTNSFLASSIAATVAEKVRLSISEQVGEAAALQFLNGFATIHDNLATGIDGANQLVDGTAQAQTGAASLADGASTLDAGAQTLSEGAASAASGAATLSSGAADAATGAATLADGASRLSSGASTLSTGANQASTGAGQLADGLGTLSDSVAGLPAATATLNGGAQKVAAGNASLATASGTVAEATQDAADRVPVVRAQIVTQLHAAHLTEAQIADVLAQLDTVGTAIDDGNDAAKGLDTQISTLADGAAQVAAGTQQLADSAPTLAAGAASAASKSTELAAGSAQVADGASTLAASASELSDGAGSLQAGTAEVADGAASLASGTQQVADGASTLASGTGQLASGASTLSTGAGQLHSGAVTLRDGLASGADQIPNYSPDERQTAAATIATPARVDTDTVTKASTYGAGMAPFFISLAAWIGIYALFLIIKPLSRRALTAIRAPLRVTAAGWLAPALLGALQMAAVYFVVTVPLGFSVANPALMLLFMVFTSITFVAIIGALNIWLGSVGQFLGLVLMVLQLVTAGGTFPWQTLPGPLAALHHVLPMSYAVDGIRQLMYGGDLSLALNDVGVLALWLVGAIAFSMFLASKKTAQRTLRDLRPSLIG
ncbi:YhgE/Pip domain-containing protein [Subtercola boreus]|uniref:ABC-2 type transporter transmembrane domain-containing protein n=1 Tax=Subtercola boreus TaxID=120213 RepID=A0A3E0W860_9MICO|nr:YhgE/Pip domain-containing protein [Subtercola boreus]RFA17982.1 hypothetical protein B7R24_15090 [Subtercola boreus]RFA18364.1 hypothetical protein B7R23_15125 [Subtercola boreus]RFA24893.1 hypothetical protein B7R25_15120 [Subtercola boreus]